MKNETVKTGMKIGATVGGLLGTLMGFIVAAPAALRQKKEASEMV